MGENPGNPPSFQQALAYDGSWHPESLLSRGLHNSLPRQGNVAHISPTVNLPMHNMLYVPL